MICNGSPRKRTWNTLKNFTEQLVSRHCHHCLVSNEKENYFWNVKLEGGKLRLSTKGHFGWYVYAVFPLQVRRCLLAFTFDPNPSLPSAQIVQSDHNPFNGACPSLPGIVLPAARLVVRVQGRFYQQPSHALAWGRGAGGAALPRCFQPHSERIHLIIIFCQCSH